MMDVMMSMASLKNTAVMARLGLAIHEF